MRCAVGMGRRSSSPGTGGIKSYPQAHLTQAGEPDYSYLWNELRLKPHSTSPFHTEGFLFTHMDFWRQEYDKRIEDAATFADLRKIALGAISKIPQPVGQVCGPLTTGGEGTYEKNVKIFNSTIERLIQDGEHMFNQIPFQNAMARIVKTVREEGELKLLHDFYGEIFKTRLIRKFFFIYRWETSSGATWEHEYAIRLGITPIYLAPDFHK